MRGVEFQCFILVELWFYKDSCLMFWSLGRFGFQGVLLGLCGHDIGDQVVVEALDGGHGDASALAVVPGLGVEVALRCGVLEGVAITCENLAAHQLQFLQGEQLQQAVGQGDDRGDGPSAGNALEGGLDMGQADLVALLADAGEVVDKRFIMDDGHI